MYDLDRVICFVVSIPLKILWKSSINSTRELSVSLRFRFFHCALFKRSVYLFLVLLVC